MQGIAPKENYVTIWKRHECRQKVNEIASRYEKALFDYNPEMATYFGKKDVALDRFKDHSLEALVEWQKQEDQFLTDLRKIDEQLLIGHPEHLTFLLLKNTLQDNIRARISKDELWNVNPQPINTFDFWFNSLCSLAEKQPVGDRKCRRLALERWSSAALVIDQELNNLRVGLQLGHTAPRPAVEGVIKQLRDILTKPVDESPFFDFAKRDGGARFKRQIANLIEHQINPAITRYVEFLEKEYLPKAREEVGIASSNFGSNAYAVKLKKETTLDIDPGYVFSFGLSHMMKLQQEVSDIGRRLFGTGNMAEVFAKAKEDPRFRFQSEQHMLEYNRAALARAFAALPKSFKRVPNSPCEIRPFAAHLAEAGISAEYHPPSEDGKTPGIFFINTHNPTEQNRSDQEATLFHELVPGHHLQSALLCEDKSRHSVVKYLGNGGYDEGWGLYVERLADEMQLYNDDISRLGMLANEALRTARLVIDPGIHVKGWTRDTAVQYLRHHSVLDEASVQSEIDRYIMAPGQATSYMLGKREIDQLRAIAQKELGEQFDLKEFHDQVLKQGSIPLPLLRTQITAWVEETKRPKPALVFSKIPAKKEEAVVAQDAPMYPLRKGLSM